MDLERETKGAVRFYEVNSNGRVATLEESLLGTIYLRKSALGGEVPASIEVTVKTTK
jgi:hypothetical protein